MEVSVRENKLYINVKEGWNDLISIEDSREMMKLVIENLIANKDVTEILIVGNRELEYDFEQTKLLREIANCYENIILKKLLTPTLEELRFQEKLSKYFSQLNELVENVKADVIESYKKLLSLKDRLSFLSQKDKVLELIVRNHILPIIEEIKNLKIIKILEEKEIQENYVYKVGDRRIYREVFSPIIRPIFMETKFYLNLPKGSIKVEEYEVKGNVKVEIYKVPNKVRYVYVLHAPEFLLTSDEITILEKVREYLAEHRPSETELKDYFKSREAFFNLELDLIRRVCNELNIPLPEKRMKELADILVRYTIGFGILERILADENVTDIYVNAPIGSMPIFVQHANYEECESNIIISPVEAENWATKFRLYSGRPLDEANPVLDTELIAPEGKARVAAITRSLNPEGLSFTLRRHRDKPWTLPLLIKKKMINPLFAGLMNFIVAGGRSFLVAGGRGSGKTSLLGAIMLEIPRKYRIIVIEDSVTKNCEIFIRRNGKIEKHKIGNLIDSLMEKYGFEIKDSGHEVLNKNFENIEVLSLNEEGKIEFKRVKSFIRHKVKKEIYKIITSSGNEIEVTGDHSLFSLDENGKIKEIEARNLKVGDYIVVARKIPWKEEDLKYIDLFENEKILKIKNIFVRGKIKRIIEENKDIIKKVAKDLGYHIPKDKKYPSYSSWKRNEMLPIEIAYRIKDKLNNVNLFLTTRSYSPRIERFLKLDDKILTFFGLWIADGCYDKNSVIISVVDEESRKLVNDIAKRFKINVRIHSDGISLCLHSRVLKEIMKNVLEFRGDAYTKKFPSWVYTLSKRQIAKILKGIFSGDGYVGKYEVGIALTSKELIKDIKSLLLIFGIVSRVKGKNKKDKTYRLLITGNKNLKLFYKHIGFLQKDKMKKLREIIKKVPSHDISDIIPLSLKTKEKLSKIIEGFNKFDYINKGYNIGREKLKKYLEKVLLNDELIENLRKLINSDIFFDKIEKIKKKVIEDYVYDLSVPQTENFLCENIIAHNTLELPVPQMRSLGFNIERLKSRSVITKVESELPAEEALRTALRLGDSALIIGEIRSTEALTLFEAMRVGALAHTVAGTIHGESAYGVFDRVVNDLKVPKTSFKAVDLIIIAANLKSADGLRRYKRVVEVTEVKKHWEEDPLAENAFAPLMIYNAKVDDLLPTQTLTSGESFVIREISKRIPEFYGNWDLVWDNILLRAKIKQRLVELSEEYNKPEILEAEFVVWSNEMFNLVSEEVRLELGKLDSKEIYKRWEEKIVERI
ncbi:MAG: ATPase, T2SS/T4P/T4SS family [Candidatus Aenigmatarchaeota archaeon]